MFWGHLHPVYSVGISCIQQEIVTFHIGSRNVVEWDLAKQGCASNIIFSHKTKEPDSKFGDNR